ncbi:hypothetical protein HPB47_015335 [Ixodes persulcatus]|uniref:Uncharacterized protein n=1 Tax=Ixodes persulcatus TaxID=34615 RepID=A0AC60QTV7_IXOPE|nr:hypothetical protein HPB47_015335 [Ixodes persulcatus]
MAASSGSIATSPCSPGLLRLEETENLRNLFLDCVRGYIAQAGSETNWPLVVRATTAMILLQRRRHPGREWVRSLLRSRETFGEYHHLVRDMRLDNGQDCYQYFRMTRQRFDHLLSLVGPSLQKETTFWREPIPPAERLALTIRYLAHGASQAICAMTFRIGRSTASEIIQETCEALRAVLEPLYRPVDLIFFTDAALIVFSLSEDIMAAVAIPSCPWAASMYAVPLLQSHVRPRASDLALLLSAAPSGCMFFGILLILILALTSRGRSLDGGARLP